MRIGLCAGLTMVLTASLPPPSITRARGWVVFRPRTQPCCTVVAVTAADAPTQRPFEPFCGFTSLRPRGVVIWATTIGRRRAGFQPIAWPPRLSAFRIDDSWEGQPAGNIQQRLLWGSVRGWTLDIRVYFATQHPDGALLAKTQAELGRLRLPRR